MATATMLQRTTQDYQTPHPNDWCPGCGDFGMLNALQHALAGLHLPPHQVALFGGIGCSGKTPYYVPVSCTPCMGGCYRMPWAPSWRIRR
jgi:2-oxoglutarate ferredoxin oxidoreductase subunit beta